MEAFGNTLPRVSKRRTFFTNIVPYLFIFPYLILFSLFLVTPVVVGLVVSFTEWRIIGNPSFVGFRNYIELFHSERFRGALQHTAIIAGLVVPVNLVGGLLVALLVNKNIKGRGFARVVIFSPYVIMVSTVAIIWLWIFNQNFGLANYYLSLLNLPSLPWLTSGTFAMISVSITTNWWVLGFCMVLFLAGLQAIPMHLYEAARIDGASTFQRFWYITLPQLRPIIFFVLVIRTMEVFRMFGQIYLMTQGGPVGATTTLVYYIYQAAFRTWRMGYASAAAYVMFIIVFLIILVQFKAVRSSIQ